MLAKCRALTLTDLPEPPVDKTGWPWTEQSRLLPERMPSGSEWPRISVVTPSYNQGKFLEETIRSVLLQGYPNLEYIIIDGGSTDESIEIIKKYEIFITYWISEFDRGQSHAINKGLMQATGDYLAWMNSDDCYMPNGIARVARVLLDKKYDFIYGSTYIGENLKTCTKIEGNRTKPLHIKNMFRFFCDVECIIPSQSVLISRFLFEKVGYLAENLHYCMDLDWFIRIVLEKPNAYKFSEPICFYRLYPGTKTHDYPDQVWSESTAIVHNYLHLLSEKDQKNISQLILYSKVLKEYEKGERSNNLIENFKTILRFPYNSLRDTRFLGLFKRSILNLFMF